MTDQEPLSSTEARRIAATLLAQLVNVRSDHPMYGNLATAALAYATLAPQLDPPQAAAQPEEIEEARRLRVAYQLGLHVVAP